MKNEAPDNLLGPYLTLKGLDSVEIEKKTGIAIGSIRKMRTGETKAIPALALYKFSLVAEDPIHKTLVEVYPNLKLRKIDKALPAEIKNNTTDLGKLIFALKDYDLNNLAHRTAIERGRLRRLTKLDSSKILSHELYLIEMASGKNPGELFDFLFNDIKLITI